MKSGFSIRFVDKPVHRALPVPRSPPREVTDTLGREDSQMTVLSNRFSKLSAVLGVGALLALAGCREKPKQWGGKGTAWTARFLFGASIESRNATKGSMCPV